MPNAKLLTEQVLHLPIVSKIPPPPPKCGDTCTLKKEGHWTWLARLIQRRWRRFVECHYNFTTPPPSLASHTLQSQEKEGLVTSRTTSCSGDRIWLWPIRFEILNLLLSNALLAACAHIAGPAWFAVTRDVFYNYCIPPEQLVVCKVTRPFSPRIEGCG